MVEASSGEPSREDPHGVSVAAPKVCPECGRIPKRWTAGKCDACYKRERRRSGTRKRIAEMRRIEPGSEGKE